MTATPRYFTGRVVRQAKEADFEVASMDDEEVFGPVFHRLEFAEAIARKLLTDYQLAVVAVDDATYRDWAQRGRFVTTDGTEVTDARTLAGQIGLAQAMRRYDLHRTITFHSRVKRAHEFAQSLPEVISWMPADQQPLGQVWSDYASGEMPAGQRHALLHHLGRLDHGQRGLLANARCLAEGVDVPTLDSVAFIDPRRSEVDIVQAVGRAIRLASDKTIGTIVIPVFVDTDEDPAVALDNSAFKPVWDVIKRSGHTTASSASTSTNCDGNSAGRANSHDYPPRFISTCPSRSAPTSPALSMCAWSSRLLRPGSSPLAC